jgi:vancomycin resistance protein YoaR
MKKILIPFWFLLLFFLPFSVRAESSITLKTDFNMWSVDLERENLLSGYEKAYFGTSEVALPEYTPIAIESFLEYKSEKGLDIIKLRDYLEREIAPEIYREKEDVVIDMDSAGKIIFEGSGLYGRRLDSEKAAFLLKKSIEQDLNYVTLPLIREEPILTLLNEVLKKKGITELISAGETNFKNSPSNRINNINVGLARFNGYLVQPGEEFSFGATLGPVNKSTGYKQELVIKGDRTIPEYGGGLCQVSTTAYRAMLSGGFPVTARKNHSYAVSYYYPIGLDATVYLPSPDLKFINDSPAHILMHSFTIDHMAYYNFYGTKDDRTVHMIGPYYTNRTGIPKPRTEYTTDLVPGERKILGHAVAGVSASWYRQITYADSEKTSYLETIQSRYQSRPHFEAIGVDVATKATPASMSMLENGY